MQKKNITRIPVPARWILSITLPDRDRETLSGDFAEIYMRVLQEKGRFYADFWIWGQILKSIPGFVRDSIQGSSDMIFNYLKTAFRIIKRNKIYSFITIFSLSVGFVSCLLIFLYVLDELSYDRYHVNASRIYRVYEELNMAGQKRRMAITPAPFGPAMKQEFPQVEDAVRFLPGDFGGDKVLISHGDKSYYEDKWFFADESVFKIFSFQLIEGDPEAVLKAPYSVVLSQTKARKIFGNSHPVGQIITLESQYFKNDFLVTGVFEDIPRNSHFTFDFLASFASVEKQLGRSLENWFNHMYYTYLLLQENTHPEELEKKFPTLIKKHTGEEGQSVIQPRLQALTSVRLHSHLEDEIQPNSDAAYIIIFVTVAVFILGIAAVNFINLATARSASRAREVGMRKVVGARRSQLLQQFLGEAVLFAVAALILALGLSQLFLPVFNSLADKSLSLALLKTWWFPLGLGLAVLLVGGLSGVYPAIYLSRFAPTRVLKGRQGRGPRSGKFRKSLIIFQFTVSIALIILNFGVRGQLHYIRTKKLGFRKNNVVVLPLRDDYIKKQYQTLKSEMLRNARVESVSASSGLPGRISHHWIVNSEGWQSDEGRPTVWVMMVDPDFIPTLGMEILEGRDLSRELTSDKEGAILINESAKSLFGWKKPLGKRIKTENTEGHVIGVVQDFHFQSFRQAIEPIILYIYPRHFSYLLIRISGEEIQADLESVRRTWKEIVPNRPFEYFFLDHDFDRFYRAEQRAEKIFSGFALLAVIIALLGLFGLATFTAEQRTKELGIRKVLGASRTGLVRMLSSEFARLVLMANVIAWPLAFYILRRWLQNFVYRAEVSPWVFVQAGCLVLGMTLITVSLQALRAASNDPVKVLRYE